MTIRIYNAVKQNYSYAPVFTDVKSVTRTEVLLNDGTAIGKKMCAKVEILTLLDAPNDYCEAKAFWNRLGIDIANQYRKMKAHEFDALDLPTYI